MNIRPMHTKRLAASLCAAGLMLAAGAVHAADAIGRAGIQSQYEQDVARCKSGNTNQDRATCLREAGAAREEALRQNLREKPADQLQQNMTARCDRLPPDARQNCITQMTSPTNVRGSVQGGGVLRETVIQVPAGSVPPSTAPGMAPPPPAPGMAPPPPAPGMAPAPGSMNAPMRQ